MSILLPMVALATLTFVVLVMLWTYLLRAVAA